MVGRWSWIALWLGLNGLGVVHAAQCDTSSPTTNLNTYLALGAGSCTLPPSGIKSLGTLSNFRYSATVTGTSTTPPSTASMGILPVNDLLTLDSSNVGLKFSANFSLPTGGAATINFAYTITLNAATQISGYDVSNELSTGPASATVTVSLCPGGTFTAFPPSGCPTGIINGTSISAPPAADTGLQNPNRPNEQFKSVDVYVQIVGNGGGTVTKQVLIVPGTITATVSKAEIDTITTTTTAPVRVDTYSTELRARIGTGSFLYDQTFKVAFSDPQVQAAITQARNALTGAGGVNLTGPTQISTTTAQSSTQTNTVTTGTQTQTLLNTGNFVGPFTFNTGNLGVCQSYTLSQASTTGSGLQSSGYPLLAGCSLPGTPFTIVGGGIDFDTQTLSLVTISQTATATNTFLTTAIYEINGSGTPTPPATPLPPSLFLAMTGVATLGFSEWRRRRRARLG